MKSKLFAFVLFLLAPFVGHSYTNELISESVNTPDQVTVINNNFRKLYSGKLDLKPGDVFPKRDSTYIIGESGNEWLAGYFDSVITSTLTASSFTATSGSFTNLTTSNSGTTALGGTITLTGTWDGWIAANETWTYISATQFSVTGNLTGKYQLGDKIKLTQTSAKYFYVTASAFSSVVTTVTVTGGTDYTLANAAITLPFYSRSETPIGFPTWFNYTATYTGWSTIPDSPGGQNPKFFIHGKTCYVAFRVPVASHGTSNSANASMTLPLAAEDDNAYSGFAYNNGVGGDGYARTVAGSTTVNIYPTAAFGGWTTTTTKSWSGTIYYVIDR